MLHKNADKIIIDPTQLEVKESTLNGQRLWTIRQGRTPLFTGKRSQIQPARIELLYKIIEQQIARNDELKERILELEESQEGHSSAYSRLTNRITVLEGKLGTVAPPKLSARKSRAPKKEEFNEDNNLGTTKS